MAGHEEDISSSTVTKTTTRRTISPYDLSSGDNPGSVISQPALRGPNYDEWADSIRLALRARKKFGFVDGKICNPGEDSEDYEDWCANNALVISWIKLTVDPALRSNLTHCDIAADLWEHIRVRYSIKSGQRVQRLKTELATCRQKGLAVEAYYGKLMKLWASLSDYQQAKTMAEVLKGREEDRVHQFLMGLDETLFGSVKSALLSRVPLPTLDEAYNAVAQDEESKATSRILEERTDGVSFAVQSQSRSKTIGDYRNKSSVCSLCGRNGHIADQCFKKIGYPSWWGEKSKSKAGESTQQSSLPSPTNNRQNQVPRANQIVTTPASANSVLTNTDRVGFSGLNDAQWQSLVGLLDERTRGNNNTTKLSGMFFLNSWIIDTGASNHMTGSLHYMSEIESMPPILIKLPDGRLTQSTQQGKVCLGSHLSLQNVYYVDGLKCHLISVSQLNRDRACVFQITDKLCVIQDRTTRMLIGAAEQKDGLYFFRSTEAAAALHISNQLAKDVWHNRLGHPSSKVLNLLPISGFSSSSDFDNKACDICMQAKQTKDVFPTSLNKTMDVFQLVHCDLWGPYRITSNNGSRYFLTLVDDFSRALWIYLLPDKTSAPTQLKNFIALVERQFNKQVKTIRSDNGSEFICLRTFFQEKGIIHETSCVGTPQQNGRVERKHRHILNVARALRFQASFPIEMWDECVLAACYLINRTPSTTLAGKTPFEKLYNRPPPLHHLRVFGCLCYVHNQHHGGDKFATRSSKSVFVGYPYGKKGWRVYNLETGIITVSRDVVFCEAEFPFASITSNESDFIESETPLFIDPHDHDILISSSSRVAPMSPAAQDIPSVKTIINEAHESSPIEPSDSSPLTSPCSSSSEPLSSENKNQSNDDIASLSDSASSADDSPNEPQSPAPTSSAPLESEPIVEQLGVGKRAKKLPTKLADYVLTITNALGVTNFDCKYPISDYTTTTRFSEKHQEYVLTIMNSFEPQHYSQAVLDEQWRNAMRSEIDALEDNGTWTVETLPPGKKAIGCKWVFRLKFKADGTLERYKARLVVLGNNQVEGIDFKETFAPVIKMTTVRTFLEVAAAKDWPVHQMDVHNAFLHGDLDEEVYMQMPPGFRTDDKSQVCRLHKSLYGLRQAPRCWFAKLSTALKEYGFVQSVSDYSLFSYARGSQRIYVLVYVDDLILSANTLDLLDDFKSYLCTCFHMKDLGVLKYFLGIEVARSPAGFYLCQRKYAMDIITETGLLGVKPVAFPLDQNHKLALAKGELLPNPERYRRLVGRLIYLGTTRPDLAYSIHILTQFMQAPRAEHLDAALRVVRYLKHNPGQGILLRSDSPLTLNVWCDADWQGCPLTRRSLTGWFIQFGNSPISWKTQKQDHVSQSSAEAEYRAMSETIKEVMWLKNLLWSLGIEDSAPIVVHCDNIAAIHLASNPVFHERTKHIERDCHFIRDEIIRGTIATKYVHTSNQLADIMTKALGRKEFESFKVKLGICDLYAPT